MIDILKAYLKRLTNLTGNNRSLLLLKLNSSQFLDIHELNFLNGHSSFSIIEDLIVAAHNSAKSNLKSKTTEEISKATGGFGIPGFKWPL